MTGIQVRIPDEFEKHDVCILCGKPCAPPRLPPEAGGGGAGSVSPCPQLPYGFQVADTLMAIFKDNAALLRDLDPEVLECFVR